MSATTLQTRARRTLGAVRLANGVIATAAPRWFGTRAGLDMEAGPGAVHVVRMFGIRTTLLGADVLVRPEGARRAALAVAPVVHAADLASAVAAGRSGALAARPATIAGGLSALNLACALICLAGARR